MMKALGDEGFLPELLNNWQEKLIHANSTVNNKTKKNRSSVTSKANYLKKRLQFQENNNISSVDQHEMAMISRNNNTLKEAIKILSQTKNEHTLKLIKFINSSQRGIVR